MKRILCSSPTGCDWPFANILDNGTIEIRRKHNLFTIIGKDVIFKGTCHRCSYSTALIIKDGKLQEDSDLVIKDVNPQEENNDGKTKEGIEPGAEPDNTNQPTGEPAVEPGTEPEPKPAPIYPANTQSRFTKKAN